LIDNVKLRNSTAYERKGFVLLTVGRIVQRKGFESVLEALKVIKDRNIDFEYRIVGGGPYKKEVLRIIDKLNLEGCVSLLGEVDETDSSYQAADIFIMPSIELPGDVEGFGIVFLEAGLHGLPVIASRSGGIPDAVKDGETGLLVTPGDVNEIAGAILLLMEDSGLRMRMGQAGHGRAIQREPISQAIEDIEQRINIGPLP
jgi:phosphatidylinositol alpha-1,6-mannosyltransferase